VHGDHLKHPFYDLTQVSFWSGELAENEFKVLWEHLKYRFFDFIQVAICALSPSNKLHFGLVKTQYEVKVLFDDLKNLFLHFSQVAVWAGQEAENEFNVPWEHFKQLFIVFIQVAFLC